MSKIKHNSGYDLIKDLIEKAKKNNVVQLQDEQASFSGPFYVINGKELLNFGYCGYLGLEHDDFIKQGSINEIKKNGLQFGVSRAYITSTPEKDLLTLLGRIFKNNRIIINSSTSSSHIGNIPNLVGKNDAIILDQQVHFSVQTGCQLCSQNGTTIEMIRHSNMEMLRRKYESLAKTHNNIWYMIDGVYSMYGDIAPFDEIIELLNSLPKLHLYCDDAHGVSWTGEKGGGVAFSKLQNHPKAILNVTMGKAFGVTGGVNIYPTDEFYQKVKIFGGPLTYSHPLSPAIIGAAKASAKIHLSSRINQLQWELFHRIRYCNELLKLHNLPVLSTDETPIFFIGMGQPSLTYNIVKRLMKDGFYVNAAIYPAVSLKCSGIRFSISRHNKLEDIELLVESISKNYWEVLNEEGVTNNEVRKAFKLSLLNQNFESLFNIVNSKPSEFSIYWFNSINQLNKEVWNKYFEGKGNFDYEGVKYLELAFSNNTKKHENFDFKYLVIKNLAEEIVFITFITIGVLKDDFLSDSWISEKVESRRGNDQYYLCSKSVMVGSIMTEGQHYFLAGSERKNDSLIKLVLEELEKVKALENAETIIFRDLYQIPNEIDDAFHKVGYLKVAMLNTNVFNELNWAFSIDSFKSSLSSSHRRHFRKDIEPNIDKFQIVIKNQAPDERLNQYLELFENVKSKNLSINYFDYPKKCFELMNDFKNWEFIEMIEKETQRLGAIIFCYKTKSTYCPMFIGIDYDVNSRSKVYKVGLFQTLWRAKELGYNQIKMGFSADLEKRKLGAEQIKTFAYIHFQDNYNFEELQTIAINSK